MKSLRVTDVEFYGRVSNADVLQLMWSATIFVLPTLTMEGHPKALIEVMAFGASDVVGNEDVILNGETGLLVPGMGGLWLLTT